jgi:pSer/pThr/pTyr-binding forkhead associated (FHA) protein
MMLHETEPTPKPASGPAFDEHPTIRLPNLWPVRAAAPTPARPASEPAFDEQPTDPVLVAWRAWAGAPRTVPSIVADILPTHGRAYARLRVRGVLDRATGASLLQTCRCLVRRNVVRIVIDVTDIEGDRARLEDLVELHLGLEKRGGGIVLIGASVRDDGAGAPSSLPTYRDERQALAALDTETPSERRQSGGQARLILPNARVWPLADSVVTIGRSIGNHLMLDDPQLAPEHAAIARAGDEYVLIDWGSGQGTFVNGGDGRDLHFLRDGDRIEIGDSILIFRSGAIATSRASMTVFDWPVLSKEHASAVASSGSVGGASFDDRRQTEGSERRTRGPRQSSVTGGPRRSARCDSDATDCAWCGDYLSWFRFSVLITAHEQGRSPLWTDERSERLPVGAPPHFVFADDSGRRWLRIRFRISLVTGWLLALAFLWWYLVLQ